MAHLDTLEHSLLLSPQDKTLWRKYQSLLCQSYGPNLPEATWLTCQFLHCLRSGLMDPRPLNGLVTFYEGLGQHFNAMLCRLASLSANPAQAGVYEAAQSAYAQGVLTPQPLVPNEPVSCTVSVILATRNRPLSLRQATASVLEQTFQDFELLVINDGGTQEARAVVDSFASPKIRYFPKECGGHRSALNLGLRATRGKYIAYLDDDDIYFPHHLETLVQAADTEHVDFVCSRNRRVVGRWEDGQWIEDEDWTGQEPFCLERLHVSAVIADLNVLHTRSLAGKVGLFWQEPPRGGEWEYWVRCSHHVPIKRLDAVTGEVRVPGLLPVDQPARAQFFTELWRVYFGSGFGEAILAVAAWCNGHEETCWQHVERLDGSWRYLNNRSKELMWTAAMSSDDTRWHQAVREIAAGQPEWVGLQVLHRFQVGNWRTLGRLPIAVWARLGEHLLSSPTCIRKVFARLKPFSGQRGKPA